MVCGSGGRTVGSLKRRVRSHLAKERWKIARCCGAKHVSKSKCTRHLSFGALLELRCRKVHDVVVQSKFGSQKRKKAEGLRPLLGVEMSKKCTSLWPEAHVEVKMYKAHQLWSIFGSWDVQKVHSVVTWSTCGGKHVKSMVCADHFWTLKHRFVWQTWRFCRTSKNVGRRGWRGPAIMHFAWQVQCKRHMSQTCSEVRALTSWRGGCIDTHKEIDRRAARQTVRQTDRYGRYR